MALAGYLISRCAEHPPVLSLTVGDRRRPGVRHRPAGRPVRRPAGVPRPRPAVAGRHAGGDRAVPGRPAAGPVRRATATATCSPGSSATSTRCRTSTCAASSRRWSRWSAAAVSVAVAAVLLPAAGVVLAAGLVAGGVGGAGAGRRAQRVGIARRRAAVRAELTADLVELLRGAPELVVLGRGRRRARADRAARRRADPPRPPRRPGRRRRRGSLRARRRSHRRRACSPSACGRPRTTGSTGSSSRPSRCWPRPRSRPSPRCRRPRSTLRATLESGRRVLQIVDPAARGPGPGDARAGPGRPGPVVLDAVGLRAAGRRRLGAARRRPHPRARATGWPWSGGPVRGKTTLAELLVRFLDPDDGRRRARGHRRRATSPSTTCGGGSPSTGRTPTCSRRRSARTCASPGPDADDAAVEDGAAPGPARRLGVAAARTGGHARRRGRAPRSSRRRAAPARAGPGAARRRPRAGPGRADRARRPPDGGRADPGRAGRRRGPHRAADHAPGG